jgi:hypothetical protein
MELEQILMNYAYEAWALEEYLDMMEKNTLRLAEEQREKRLDLLRTVAATIGKDNMDSYGAERSAEAIVRDIIPRYMRGSFIVAVWSFFEQTITEAAKFAETFDQPRISFSAIRGDFLTRTRIFFEAIPVFWNQEEEIDKLKIIEFIRHQVVHSNLKITARNLVEAKRLASLGIGLDIVGDRISIQESFCQASYDLVSKVLVAKIMEIHQSYPY